MANTVRELSNSIDLTKLIQAGFSLLLAEEWNPKVSFEGNLSKSKIADILSIIFKLLEIAMTEGQMREFLVCFPIKSTRDQLSFIDVGTSFLLVWRMIPILESQGVIPIGTITLKSDIGEAKPALILIRYLIEGLLLKENTKKFPNKSISLCSFAKDSSFLFRNADFLMRLPEGIHYWLGALTKTSILLKQRITSHPTIHCAMASLADHTIVTAEK